MYTYKAYCITMFTIQPIYRGYYITGHVPISQLYYRVISNILLLPHLFSFILIYTDYKYIHNTVTYKLTYIINISI